MSTPISHQHSLQNMRKKRAVKYKAQGSFTECEWFQLLEFYGWKCVKCGKSVENTEICRDHVQPISKGGSDFIQNIQPLCWSCNSQKRNKHIDYRPCLPPETFPESEWSIVKDALDRKRIEMEILEKKWKECYQMYEQAKHEWNDLFTEEREVRTKMLKRTRW